MKKSVAFISTISCLTILYNVLIFTLTKNFSQNFWVSYALVMLSILIMLASFIVTKLKASDKVLGMPITTLSVYYFVIEIVLASSLMFFKIHFLAVFLPQIIVLLVFLMIYIPALISILTLKKEQ